MYRIAVIVNENETLHSVYADTVSIVKKSLKMVYNDIESLYSFETLDKFNIFSLFSEGEYNLFTFDCLFIATNACNNKEIYDCLVKNKEILERFIDDGNGNHHGLLILNQQKLGDVEKQAKFLEFLPEKLSYKLV